MPPGMTRSPSMAIRAGSRVDRGQDRDGDHGHRAERHRAQRLVVDHPETGQRDDHGEAGEGDGEAGGGERLGARLVAVAAGAALLAVAGEDEERVVDRHPDPDHRGHVGDEDRGRHLQREEVDERAGDDDADEAERQRQRGRRQRAEDDEQDQGDDREAARLGLGQVFLGELLHPRPDRRLPGKVGRDAVRRRCPGSRSSRSVDGRVDELRRAERSLRSGSSAVPSRCSWQPRRGARPPAEASLVERRRRRAANRRDRGGPLRRRPAPGSARSSTAMPSACEPKSLSSASLTAFDWLPGTSKPPPVRCSVCFAASGRARTTIRIQAARTQRRRRPRNPASRIIDIAHWLVGQLS